MSSSGCTTCVTTRACTPRGSAAATAASTPMPTTGACCWGLHSDAALALLLCLVAGPPKLIGCGFAHRARMALHRDGYAYGCTCVANSTNRGRVGREYIGNTNTGTDEVIHNIAAIMRPNLRATGSTMPARKGKAGSGAKRCT